ncbi:MULTISPECIES: hypothetical protein [Microbispora]|nr:MULTISPECIES: hypothetical protein [Microbispora]
MRFTRAIAAAFVTVSALLVVAPVAAHATPSVPSDPPWDVPIAY